MDLATPAPLVRLTDVEKRFASGAAALGGFSLSVQPGEFVSLLGPSGCGKSTSLRIIAELTRATSGEVSRSWSCNHEADHAPVGCVFQQPTLMPWATTWNNVYLPLRLQGLGKRGAKQEVDRALELVGLSEFAGAYPRQLSGGMQMRAAVARALVTRPKLLLLDEPFAALDEITRFRLNDDLLDLWRQRGFAALLVTHSVYESVFLSSRVVVMSARPGRAVADIPVGLPRPRTEALRSSPEYLEVCREVSEALHATFSQAGAAG